MIKREGLDPNLDFGQYHTETYREMMVVVSWGFDNRSNFTSSPENSRNKVPLGIISSMQPWYTDAFRLLVCDRSLLGYGEHLELDCLNSSKLELDVYLLL